MGFENDSSRPAAPRAIVASTEAQACVADLDRTFAFYTQHLGFTVAFVAGDPPFYGQLVRDGARLNVRAIDEPVFAGDVRDREQILAATFTIADRANVDRLFAEYRNAGVPFEQLLREEPWGAATFVVRDPDGNRILFAGPAV